MSSATVRDLPSTCTWVLGEVSSTPTPPDQSNFDNLLLGCLAHRICLEIPDVLVRGFGDFQFDKPFELSLRRMDI